MDITANLVFGVVSDIHMHEVGGEGTLVSAFEYFRDHGADAVAIVGDMANTGLIEQLQIVADVWKRVFPEDKAPDGRSVERLFIYGNHDWEGQFYGDYVLKKYPDEVEQYKHLIQTDPKAAWEKVFGEPYEPIWTKYVKGYAFVGTNWMANDEAAAYLEKHAPAFDPSKPFFYLQHRHLKDTCYGAWAWGHDEGDAGRVLAKYSNAFALSGHSHYTLTDERSVWQGAFTAIGTSSLHYTATDYSLRENMPRNRYGYKDEKRPHRMDNLFTGDGRQGMLFKVFGDRVEIERREFVTGRSLGADWVLPATVRDGSPFAFAEHAARRVAPEFAAGATAAAVKDGDRITVSFPAAQTRCTCRVFEYDVRAILEEDDVSLVQASRRVMAPDFHLPETPEGRPGFCVFACEDLPYKGRYRFEVRPVECFRHVGAPISSNYVAVE